jgi:transposase
MLCTLGGAQAIGRSRGGLTTKLHVVVEALGNLARWRLTAGRAADVTEAEPLLEGIPAEAVAADKAYGSQALIDSITRRGAQAVIPPRSNRAELGDFDRHTYKGRNLVERLLRRSKHFRRVATRYDKLDRRCEAFIAIAAAWIWLAYCQHRVERLPIQRQRLLKEVHAKIRRRSQSEHGRRRTVVRDGAC